MAEAEKRLKVIERLCAVLPDNPATYQVWKRIVTTHAVKGVQAHDAKIVAWMITQAIKVIITLNRRDFIRYPEIEALTPENLLQS